MSLTICHASDLHGNIRSLLASDRMPDVFVLTGDIFPNESNYPVFDSEVREQNYWFNDGVGDQLVKRFGNRPVITVSGNHDFVNLASMLRARGVEAYDMEIGPVEILGERFAGFRSINWIEGRWQGEEHDLSPMVEKAFSQDPTVLVTHAPPSGILDQDVGGHGYGIKVLTQALAYRPHRIKASLFGHSHHQGRNTCEEMGILFSNAATGVNWLEV